MTPREDTIAAWGSVIGALLSTERKPYLSTITGRLKELRPLCANRSVRGVATLLARGHGTSLVLARRYSTRSANTRLFTACIADLSAGRPRLGGYPTFSVTVRGPRATQPEAYEWEETFDAPAEAVAGLQRHLAACLAGGLVP